MPILLFEIGAICHLLSGAAIRFNDGLCSISATVASNSFHSMQRKDKSRKLTKIGLSFGGGFPLQGAGYGDAGAFRKSARAMRGYLSRPPTVTRCESLPRTNGQRPLRTTLTDLCTALWCECAHKTTLEMHRNGPAGAGSWG